MEAATFAPTLKQILQSPEAPELHSGYAVVCQKLLTAEESDTKTPLLDLVMKFIKQEGFTPLDVRGFTGELPKEVDPHTKRLVTQLHAEILPDQTIILAPRVSFNILVQVGEKCGIISFQRAVRSKPIKPQNEACAEIGKSQFRQMIRICHDICNKLFETLNSQAKLDTFFGEALATPYVVCDAFRERDELLNTIYGLIDSITYKKDTKKKFDPKKFNEMMNNGKVAREDKETVQKLQAILQKNETKLPCDMIIKMILDETVRNLNYLFHQIMQKTGKHFLPRGLAGCTFNDRHDLLKEDFSKLKSALKNRKLPEREVALLQIKVQDNLAFLEMIVEEMRLTKRAFHHGIKRLELLSILYKNQIPIDALKECKEGNKATKQKNILWYRASASGIDNIGKEIRALLEQPATDTQLSEMFQKMRLQSWPANYRVTQHHIAKFAPSTPVIIANPATVEWVKQLSFASRWMLAGAVM